MFLELSFDIKHKLMNINISINKKYKYDYDAHYMFLLFVKAVISHKKIHIISLEEGIEIANGRFKEINYKSSFGNIDYEIEFIQSVLIIEKKYNKKIMIPDELDEESYENILYLAKGISDGKVEGSWNEFNSTLELLDETLDYLDNISDEVVNITFEHERNLNIFGEEYKVPKILTHMLEAKFKDVDKLKKKVSVLEKGDLIKITLVSAENKKYVDEFTF